MNVNGLVAVTFSFAEIYTFYARAHLLTHRPYTRTRSPLQYFERALQPGLSHTQDVIDYPEEIQTSRVVFPIYQDDNGFSQTSPSLPQYLNKRGGSGYARLMNARYWSNGQAGWGSLQCRVGSFCPYSVTWNQDIRELTLVSLLQYFCSTLVFLSCSL